MINQGYDRRQLRILSSSFTVISAIVFMSTLYLTSFFIVNGNFGQSFVFDLYPLRILESFISLLFSAFFMDRIFYGSKNPSRIVFFSYYIFLVVPLLVIFGLRDDPPSRSFVYMVVLCFFVSIVVSQFLPRVRIPVLGKRINCAMLSVLFLMTVYVYACLVVGGGLDRFNFDLYKVYEVRAQLDFSFFPLLGYFLPWQAHVVNMFFLVLGLVKRSKFIMIIAVVLQLSLFGMTNFKSFLFAPILVVLLYKLSRRNNLFGLMIWGGIASLATAAVFYFYTDEIIVPSIIIRRLFLVPANIHFWYYDFFSQSSNPHVYLSNSFLSPFSNYPYDMPITTVMSWEYLNNLAGGINVGYLGDAYTHFGLFGMLFFSVLLGLFMSFLDSVASEVPVNVSSAVIAIPAMALVNSAFFTTMLTHGLFLSLICLFMLSGVVKCGYCVKQ